MTTAVTETLAYSGYWEILGVVFAFRLIFLNYIYEVARSSDIMDTKE